MELNTKIDDFFSIDYGKMIKEHRDRIQRILREYDVAIFMARKSICLLRTFAVNHEIDVDSKCRILSSRALSYNCIDELKGKKIAIIDDVVVFGKTITNVTKRLCDNGINPDVYILACENDFFDQIPFKDQVKEGYQYIEAEEIHQISNQITEYIVCSGVPYNIDQPMYSVHFKTKEDMDAWIYNSHITTELTDGMQLKCGIENITIHFRKEIVNACKLSSVFGCSTVLKIRFIRIKDELCLKVVPIVLLPELTYEEVDRIYYDLVGNIYDRWVVCDDRKHEEKNKLKLLHYFLADALFRRFAELNSITDYEKVIWNERTLFSYELKSNEKKNCFDNLELVPQNEIECLKDRFLFDQIISETYEFLSINNRMESQKEKQVLLFDDIAYYLKDRIGNTDTYLVSTVIDVLIDKGILVPTIKNDDKKGRIVRGYRLGEIFKLTEDSINLFHSMLYRFQVIRDAELDRMVFEKLCVVFMRKIGYSEKGILSAAKEYSDDTFSICYTRFGPRVSSSSSITEVPSYSTFASRMLSESRMKYAKKGKYRVNPTSASFPKGWEFKAANFAISYAQLCECFGGSGSIRNNYIRSFNDLMTMLAIGRNNEDRLYSLVAELRLFERINTEQDLDNILYDMHHYRVVDYTYKIYKGIMDGIGSGMWKYACFCNTDLIPGILSDACNIRKVDSARYIMEDYLDETVDCNPAYIHLIEKCAKLLYEIGFVFERAYKKYRSLDSKPLFRKIVYEQSVSGTMTETLQKLETQDDYVREFQRLQARIKPIVDETNLIAEKHSYLPLSRYSDCFAFRDDNRVIQSDDKRFTSEAGEKWILVPRDNGIELDFQAQNIKDRYALSNSDSIFYLGECPEFFKPVQNGNKIKSKALEELLDCVSKGSMNPIISNGSVINVTYNHIFFTLKEGEMRDINITNNNDRVGASITGGNNCIEQSAISQDNERDIYDIIMRIELDPQKFSKELINELNEIKDDCKLQSDDKNSKYRKIMSKLGIFVKKITADTARTVIPAAIMTILKNEGYLL